MTSPADPRDKTTLDTNEKVRCATAYFLNETQKSDRRIERNLMLALGCPHRYKTKVESLNRPPLYEGRLAIPDVPFDTLAAVRESLPLIFRAIVRKEAHFVQDIASLLAGMQSVRCWPVLLETEDATYDLAIGVCKLLGVFDAEFSLYGAVENDIVALLNDWLRPASRWERMPVVSEVCVHMFGPAWCSLAAPSSFTIQDLLLRDRPTFLGRVCPVQTLQVALSLPELQPDP
jgi:hypothetical protein